MKSRFFSVLTATLFLVSLAPCVAYAMGPGVDTGAHPTEIWVEGNPDTGYTCDVLSAIEQLLPNLYVEQVVLLNDSSVYSIKSKNKYDSISGIKINLINCSVDNSYYGFKRVQKEVIRQPISEKRVAYEVVFMHRFNDWRRELAIESIYSHEGSFWFQPSSKIAFPLEEIKIVFNVESDGSLLWKKFQNETEKIFTLTKPLFTFKGTFSLRTGAYMPTQTMRPHRSLVLFLFPDEEYDVYEIDEAKRHAVFNR